MRLLLPLLLLLSAALATAQERQGYRLSPTRVTVDRAAHWNAWEAATGSLVIAPDGTVEPRFMRRDIDAMRDASDFIYISGEDTLVGGIREVGSGEETAELLMDGDPTTAWEPDPEGAPADWYLEVDLGRSVVADRIDVRFAATGDPFLKFRVMYSDGREGLGRDRGLTFYRAGQITWPNKDQRQFSFEIHPHHPQPEGMSGEVMQIVRIEALDSDGPRGEQISAETYRDLPAIDQGSVDYYRQTVSGRRILIDAETYRALPAEERGPVRYFRRERPRLAELAVRTPGDNVVTLTQRLRFEDMNLFENILVMLTTDGFFRTAYFMRFYDSLRDRYQLEIDLGAKFWLDRIRLLSSSDPLGAYQIRVSDGGQDPAGGRVWTPFEERLNREAYLQVEETFSPREVRYIEVRRLEVVGAESETGTLSEVQAYGEGYVSEVTLTSPIIRLDRSRIVTAVDWEGEAPPDTRSQLRTRSGDRLQVIEEYYDIAGRQVSKEDWETMRVTNRGEKIEREIPGPDWSDWSEIYQTPGEPFHSPGPRRYAMAQLRLLTRNPLRRASIRSLTLELAPPLVDLLTAEIWPVQKVQPGVDQEFTLYIRPRFQAGDSGFDRVRLRSSSVAPIDLISFAAGSETELRFGSAQPLWPGSVERSDLSDGSVELLFPEPILGGNRIYVARFRTRLFLSGTTFIAELLRADRPGVVQAATPGDATSIAASQSLVVIADLEKTALLDRVVAEPPIITPNGDGVNDRTEIRFSIYRLKKEHLLHVQIHDLSGHRVRDLSIQREKPSGEHLFIWDGRNEDGNLVPPGIYLYQIRLDPDADIAGTRAAGLIHVAY